MEGRPLYRTLAAIGLAAHALSSLIHVVLVGGDDRTFFVVILAIALVAAVVTWSWSKGIWVSLVAGLLLEVATFWFVFPITQGFAISALDVVPALIGFVGVWTAIIASIRGVMTRRDARGFTDATRRKVLTGVGVIALLAVVSTALTFMNKETVSADEAAGATEVVMHDLDKFAPARLEVASGEKARFVVRNDDPIAHTFTVKEYDVNEVVGPGSSKIIEFTPTKTGKAKFLCEFHMPMKGDLVVT
ncbi:MAG TPA: cupredoxin domain-containing protein [Mycobacteriales bacterium]|nr:cupredoxin domain-containing protein [Mycobacteriales bacterium]